MDGSKESQEKLSIEEKWLHMLKTVDTSMTRLAMSLDAVHVTAGLLLEYLEKPYSCLQDEAKGTARYDQHLPLRLLLHTERSVLHDKSSAMTSLQDFLHFTRGSLANVRGIPEEGISCLSLDNYLSKSDETKSLSSMSTRISEELKMENERLKEDLSLQRRYEDNWNNEKVILNSTIKNLEKQNDMLQINSDSKDQDISQLRQQVENVLKEKKDVQELSKNLSEVRNANEILQKTLQDLRLENEMLVSSVEAFSSSEKEKEDTNKDLSAEKLLLEKELSLLQTNYEKDRLKAVKDKDELLKEIERLKSKKSEDKVMGQMKSDYQHLQLESALHEQAMEAKEREMKSMKSDYQDLKQKCAKQEQELETKEREMKNMKSDCQHLEQKCAKQGQELETKEREMKSMKTDYQHLQQRCAKQEQELETNEREMKSMQSDNQHLQQKCAKQEQELETKEREMKSMKSDYQHLQQRCEKQEQELETKDREINSDYQHLQQKFEKQKLELETKEREMKSMKSDSQHLQQKCAEQKQELEKKEREMKSMKNDNQHLQQKYTVQEQTLETKEQEMKSMLSKVKQSESITSDLKIQNGEIKVKMEQQQNVNASLSQKNKNLEDEMVKFKLSCQKKDKEVNEMKHKVSGLDAEIADLQQCMEVEKETRRMLEETNRSLQEENLSLSIELDAYKSKKMIQVQLYCQRRGDLIGKVEEELVSLLKSKIEKDGKFELQFTKCLNASDVNPNIPLLLLCISASRIGTDAAVTVQGLNLTSKMALLIFHHKDEHALPNQASYQVLTGKEFTILGGICDLAFLTGKGIYSCAMNEASMKKILHFITE